MESSQEGQVVKPRLWHQELHNLLIEQGLQGYRQQAILKHFKGRVTDGDLVGYLELLLKEDRVQKFKYNKSFWWRATINLPKQKTNGGAV